MPNQPKTPGRSVRVPDGLWTAAQGVAAGRGETLTDVILRALRAYTAAASTGGVLDGGCTHADTDPLPNRTET